MNVIPDPFKAILPSGDAGIKVVVQQRIGGYELLHDPKDASFGLRCYQKLGGHVRPDGPVSPRIILSAAE